MQYQSYYRKMEKIPVLSLYRNLLNIKATCFKYKDLTLSNLATGGCSYHINNGEFNGCSMCNLHSDSLEQTAMLNNIRVRSPQLYTDLVIRSFINARGKIYNRPIHEFIFGYSLLDPKEVPDEALETILTDKNIYNRKAFVYEFETSAKTITAERLTKIRNLLGNRKIIIRIGVECKDEFIRNHWLNKSVYDRDIEDAVRICHDHNIQIVGNVLFGIPGMTEQNNIKLFLDTLTWMAALSFDGYSCSVLDRKNNTLQHFIYQNMNQNVRLNEYGISYGEHTGLPWLFSFFDAIALAQKKIKDLDTHLIFSQFNTKYVQGKHTITYNATCNCKCYSIAKTIFREKSFTKFDYSKFYQQYIKDPCYPLYLNILEKQKKIQDVKINLAVIVEELIHSMWDNMDDIKKYTTLVSKEFNEYFYKA